MSNRKTFLLGAVLICLASLIPANSEDEFRVGDKVYVGNGGNNAETEGTVVKVEGEGYNIHFDRIKNNPKAIFYYDEKDVRRRDGRLDDASQSARLMNPNHMVQDNSLGYSAKKKHNGDCSEELFKQLISAQYMQTANQSYKVTISFQSFSMGTKKQHVARFPEKFPGRTFEVIPIQTRFTVIKNYIDPNSAQDQLRFKGSYIGYKEPDGQCACSQLKTKSGSQRKVDSIH